jgi:ATP-dependent Lhr-like helicase
MRDNHSKGFEKLDKKVQKWIWDKGWDHLRDIQEESIDPILSAKDNVIISSATASGKTEAAYLPIFSYILKNPTEGIRVLYISPLKALINDQYHRIDELGEQCQIPIFRWHGDVSQSQKKRLIKNPSGILLITPESLESLVIHHNSKLNHLFNGLSFIVIDELHSFLDNERGRQVQSLLARLGIVLKKKVAKIGLSATIGDMNIAAQFICFKNEQNCIIIESTIGDRELKLQIRCYKKSNANDNQNIVNSDEKIADHIFKVLRTTDNLIFCNARSTVEKFADKLRMKSIREKLPNEFFPHHGNLSKEIRHEAEKRIKEKYLPTNIICTSTLELGIDLGNVVSIAQIGCPVSVISMCQRLGRSGRKDTDPSIIRIYIEEEEIDTRSSINNMLHERLFQSIAMVELLLKKWLEPPSKQKLHYSTMIQQILSIIAQYGGIKVIDAWNILFKLGAFKEISKGHFKLLLKHLGEEDILNQMSDGTLVLGLKGERIVNHYSFYAAFKTYDEYRLVSNEKTLGSIPIDYPLAKDQYLIFAGKRWIVIEVNEKQKVIILNPSGGGKLPLFSGGGIQIHDMIREQMYKLYSSEHIPRFINEEAVDLLKEGRDNFKRFGLDTHRIMPQGDDTLFFAWTGDCKMNTLRLLLQEKNLRASKEGFVLKFLEKSPKELLSTFKNIKSEHQTNALELAKLVQNKKMEKYDYLLPELLLCEEYASKNIDIQGALDCIPDINK